MNKAKTDRAAESMRDGRGVRRGEQWNEQGEAWWEQNVKGPWRRWVRGPEGRAGVARWVEEFPVLGEVEPEALGERLWWSGKSVSVDPIQAALVAIAQGGDHGAVMALAGQMVPGLMSVCRSELKVASCSRRDVWASTLATFVERVYAHSLESRPVKIGANLILDTRGVMCNSRVPVDLPLLENDGRESSISGFDAGDGLGTVEVREAVRAALMAWTGSHESRQLTYEMVRLVWFEEYRVTDAADELGMSPCTVSERLRRVRALVRKDLLVAA